MPLRLITVVGLLNEVLTIVSCPEEAPEAVGSKATLNVTVWLTLKVSGKVAPDTEKPDPVTVTALTVMGSAPLEVSVIVCVAVVFRLTSPNEMLVALRLSAALAAFNWRAKVFETVPAIAERVTVCAELTDDTVAEKLALEAPAATVTEDGTVTAELLLEIPTVKPPLAAAAFKATVQASVPAPVMDELVQDSAVSTGTPVPLSDMVVELPVDELLVTVSWPVAAPATEGSNCTVSDVV